MDCALPMKEPEIVDALLVESRRIDMAGPVLSVDKYLRSTSNPSVFGAGGTISGPQLSALAT